MGDYAVEIFRRNTKILEYTVYDASGNPVNLSEATLYFTVKDGLNGDLLFQKTSENISSIAITDASGGVFRVYIYPLDTSGVEPKDYLYDIVLENQSGRFTLFPPDIFRVKEGVG